VSTKHTEKTRRHNHNIDSPTAQYERSYQICKYYATGKRHILISCATLLFEGSEMPTRETGLFFTE